MHIDTYTIIYCKIYLQTYRHDMTYSVLKVPLNPNQPTNLMDTDFYNLPYTASHDYHHCVFHLF